jgi:hypothetical protein
VIDQKRNRIVNALDKTLRKLTQYATLVTSPKARKEKILPRSMKRGAPGGMRNLKFVGNSYKFTAIPIAGGFFKGEPISDQRYTECNPTCDVVDLLKIH